MVAWARGRWKRSGEGIAVGACVFSSSVGTRWEQQQAAESFWERFSWWGARAGGVLSKLPALLPGRRKAPLLGAVHPAHWVWCWGAAPAPGGVCSGASSQAGLAWLLLGLRPASLKHQTQWSRAPRPRPGARILLCCFPGARPVRMTQHTGWPVLALCVFWGGGEHGEWGLQ